MGRKAAKSEGARPKKRSPADALEKLRALESIINQSPAVVFLWRVAPGWPVDFVSDNVIQFGYSKDDLVSGRVSWVGITHPDDVPRLEAEIADYTRRGVREFTQQYRLFSRSGDICEVEDRTVVVVDKNGTITHLQGVILDVTKRKRVEEALRASEETYKGVVDNIGIGVAVISPEMEILTLNKQMKEWFPRVDVPKRPVCYEAFNNPPRDAICPYCPTVKTLQDGLVHEAVTDTPSGSRILHYRLISSPVFDKDGNVAAAIEVVDDITKRQLIEEELRNHHDRLEDLVAERTAELKILNAQLEEEINERRRVEDELRNLSLKDELTSLFNRRGFFAFADQQLKLAARMQKGTALLYADVDNMKWINDTFGHKEGDRALLETACALKEAFRESDVIARIGGDEFAVFAITSDRQDAEGLLSRLKENIEQRNGVSELRCRLSLSAGITYTDPDLTRPLEELMDLADRSMYERKQRKRRKKVKGARKEARGKRIKAKERSTRSKGRGSKKRD